MALFRTIHDRLRHPIHRVGADLRVCLAHPGADTEVCFYALKGVGAACMNNPRYRKTPVRGLDRSRDSNHPLYRVWSARRSRNEHRPGRWSDLAGAEGQKRSPDKPCTETPLTGSFPTTRPATVVVPLPVPFRTGFERLPRICRSPVVRFGGEPLTYSAPRDCTDTISVRSARCQGVSVQYIRIRQHYPRRTRTPSAS